MDVQRSGQPREEHERAEEARRLRRLQVMMSMVMSVLSQDPDLTLKRRRNGRECPAGGLNMFPVRACLRLIYRRGCSG